MAARAPRRSFARRFVITLATAPACFVSSSTPPSQPVSQAAPGQPTQSDPAPATPPPSQSPVIIANPPHPTSSGPAEQAPPPPPETATAERHWTIMKTATSCQAIVDVSCPAGVMCNPPPPQPYACPKLVKLPAKVVTFGKDECIVQREPIQCPPNTMCNPPPPQRVPCPK